MDAGVGLSIHPERRAEARADGLGWLAVKESFLDGGSPVWCGAGRHTPVFDLLDPEYRLAQV